MSLVEAYMETQDLKKKMKLQEEYIKFLEEECERASLAASVHGWKCPDDVLKKGEEFRAKLLDYDSK